MTRSCTRYGCGADITSRRSDAIYCSARCRSAGHYARHSAARRQSALPPPLDSSSARSQYLEISPPPGKNTREGVVRKQSEAILRLQRENELLAMSLAEARRQLREVQRNDARHTVQRDRWRASARKAAPHLSKGWFVSVPPLAKELRTKQRRYVSDPVLPESLTRARRSAAVPDTPPGPDLSLAGLAKRMAVA